MNTQEAIDFLSAYVGHDLAAREALSVLVVKISEAADALADVNDIAAEIIAALEQNFGPKPEELSVVDWIASLAQNTERRPE